MEKSQVLVNMKSYLRPVRRTINFSGSSIRKVWGGDYLKGQSDRIKTLKKTFGLLGKKRYYYIGFWFLKSLIYCLGLYNHFFITYLLIM